MKYDIEIWEKISKISQDDFNNDIKLIDGLVKIKGNEPTYCREQIKNIIRKADTIIKKFKT